MIDVAPQKLETLKKHWKESVLAPQLKKNPERQAKFTTSSEDLEVDVVYVPGEVTGADADAYQEKLGFPGEFPYTRGVQSNMYRGRFWTMRQYAGFGNAKESNERYKFLIAQGQTGLSVAFDLPTQIGYDADHVFAEGEVGKVGVSISSLRDMQTLLDGIPLDKVSISMTINAPAAVLLAMVIAVGKQQGVPPSALRGTIQNDILKEYIARGTYIFPPAPSMRLITDIFRYCAAEVPKWNTISISGYHIREAGSTAAQEVAFTLANGIEYVKTAIAAGLDVDEFAGQLSFFFNAHNNFLEEVAKFRAARRLWAHIMRDRFGAKDSRSWRLRFHTQTAGSTLTAQQPDNNIIRVTIQALSAVLGRHAEPAHQQQGRGPGPAHAEGRRDRAAHAADHRLRERLGRHGGPAGRLLLCRGADRRDRAPRPGIHRQDRRTGRRTQGRRGRLHQPRDPGCGLSHTAHDREERAGGRRRQSFPDQRAEHGRPAARRTKPCAPTR